MCREGRLLASSHLAAPAVRRLNGLLAVWLAALAVGGLAAALRAANLADFFTVDEATFWILRVHHFGAALAARDWASTWQTEHPGVTTMWLGLAGERLAVWLGVATANSPRAPSAAYLGLLRLPIALVNGAAVGCGYLALRRLLPAPTALLGAALWACSPFLIAFGRLLHVDGLATSFATLAVLLLLLDDWPALVGSGVCLGLALLSKTVTLVLLPWGGLLLLAGALAASPRLSRGRALWGAAARFLVWVAVAALTCLALWPALWADPAGTLRVTLAETFLNGGEPHATGNFFLGQPSSDPGWGFYPVALLYRGTPLLLAGLLALPLALARPSAERRALLGLLAWALLFGLAVSAAAKKFDRYLLPAWPALAILAAAGLVAVGRRLAQLAARRGGLAQLVQPALVAGVLLLLLWDRVAASTPMGYYNPLLGGGAAAQRALLVGWGEGMEQVGAWLSARPDLRRGTVLTWMAPTLAPFVPQDVRLETFSAGALTRRNPPANYAVLYVRGAQRDEAGGLEATIRRSPALYTLTRDGITYATIHQLPRAYDTPAEVTFDDRLTLRGFSAEVKDGALTVTPSWDVRSDQAGGTFVFIHLIAPDGRRVTQVDAPIDEGLFPGWQAGQQFGGPLPLSLPEGLAAGEYRVVLGVYTPDGGRRLAPDAGALPEAEDGPGAVLLTTVTLP
jgi:4-amino-4-deoxy-L-arabinose transferase-like glycosyltransferase